MACACLFESGVVRFGVSHRVCFFQSLLFKEESAMDVTRRDFVRGAGVIGAGALLAGVTGARGQAAAGGAASTSANGAGMPVVGSVT